MRQRYLYISIHRNDKTLRSLKGRGRVKALPKFYKSLQPLQSMDIQQILTLLIEIAIAFFLFITIAGLAKTFINAFCEARRKYQQKQIIEQYEFLMTGCDYHQLFIAASRFNLIDRLPDRKKTTIAYAIATYQLS
jgi:hypothetical protein